MARARRRAHRVYHRPVRLGAAFMLGAGVTVTIVALALRSWVDVVLGVTLSVTACRDL